MAVASLVAYVEVASSQPPPVVIVDAVRGAIQETLQFSGTLISLNEARLSAEVDGRVVRVAQVGIRLYAGKAVARLDSTLLESLLAENQAEVQRHRARIRFLQNEVARLQELASNNNAAVSLLEETQADLEATRSEVAAALARVAQTQEKIYRSTVVAPFSGVISEVHTEVGEWVSAGDPIADLVDTEALEIETHVSADVLPHISVGDRVEIRMGDETHEATLQVIVPVGDKVSRLFELRLAPRGAIGAPGMAVRVLVPKTSSRDSLLVPEDALVIRGDGISVFRIEEDMTASRIPVKIGLSTLDGLIEIDGAVEARDKIVIRGGERLRDGSTVRVVSPAKGDLRGGR